jgi:hypothetical protein
MEATLVTCFDTCIVAGSIFLDPTKTRALTFSDGLVPTSYVVYKERSKKHKQKITHTKQQKQKHN